MFQLIKAILKSGARHKPLLRASAHKRFFCRRGERAGVADYFLVVRTDDQRNDKFLYSYFPQDLVHTVCALYKLAFFESVAVCTLLLGTRAKRRKKIWLHPLVSQRLLKGQNRKLYEDLRMHPKKFFGYSGMRCSNFDELFFMIRPKITYQNTVMRVSVPPEERLAVTVG
jgi:hypothetical protein